MFYFMQVTVKVGKNFELTVFIIWLCHHNYLYMYTINYNFKACSKIVVYIYTMNCVDMY